MSDHCSIIYDAAKSQNWPRVMELCASHAHFASFAGGLDGKTSVHLALQNQCREPEVFETLLEASPETLLMEDNEGMVPLHYACRHQAAPEVVGLLLHLHPDRGHAAVSRRDQRGRTPLHYAERFDSPPEVIDMLRSVNPGPSGGAAERRASGGGRMASDARTSSPSSSRPAPPSPAPAPPKVCGTTMSLLISYVWIYLLDCTFSSFRFQTNRRLERGRLLLRLHETFSIVAVPAWTY